MNRRRLLALSGSILAGALAGCTAPEPGRTPEPTAVEPAVDPSIDDSTLDALVSDTNAFSLALFRDIAGESAAENGLVSPLSVSTTLAMVYAGARGDTRTEMQRTLDYSLGEPSLHEAYNAVQRALNDRSADLDPEAVPSSFDASDDPVPFELSLVNAVWGQRGFPFEDSFLQVLEDHYGGGLRTVDYRADPEATRETINAWVADRTGDRIDELLPKGSIDTLTRLVLTNAVYFKANWQDPFDPEDTETGSFTPLDGSSSSVPMMQKEEPIAYAEVDGTKAIELPYLGEAVSMLFVLPPENEFRAYEQGLDQTSLETLIGALERQQAEVKIPTFSFADGHKLKPILQSLGMETAFEPSAADFSGMADLTDTQERLFLEEVFHDTDITVDETGTEAAAATGAVVGFTSAPAAPVTFVADRPFLFAIRDRPTGAILFLGRVVDAGAAQ